MSADESFVKIDAMLEALNTLTTIATQNEHKWHWRKLRVYADALFKRGPFQVGDRVRLKVTPEINEKKAWGWIGSKHAEHK